MQLTLGISALVFLAVTLLSQALFKLLSGRGAKVYDRLQKFTSSTAAPNAPPAEAAGEKIQVLSLRSWLKRLSRVFASFSYAKYMERELMRADIPLRGEEYIFLTVCAALLPPLLLWLISPNIPLMILTSLLGLVLPFFWLRHAKNRRVERFNEQMGEGLSVLTNSLRAGHSFLQATELVSQETSPPLSDEFSLLMREIKLGATTEEALNHLGERVPSPDLELMITAVLIQRQLGGNLAEILDNISHTIRERVRIQGEVKTLTAQGRISGIIIGLLPVAVIAFLFIVNPGYISLLFTHPWGRVMIAYGVVSELVGLMLIQRIVKVEV